MDVYKLLLSKNAKFLKLIFCVVVIFIMSNVNAIVDFYLHPEIAYFDSEHLIVGSISGLLGFIFCVLVFLFINRLEVVNSERDELLRELTKAKENAEASNRLKSAFLANLSHELRTPLNGILGSADILTKKIQEPKLKTFIDHITTSGKNLLALINDILDLSKIEAGKIQIILAETNVQDFILGISNIFSIWKEESEVDFKVTVSASVPTTFFTDTLRLGQVLSNLLGNAFKFTEKGTITLAVSSVENQYIIFEVKDTGIGIAADQQVLIFEPFHQQEKQNHSKYGGTGLGLSISKRLTELLGGQIKLTSEKEVGSVFTVTLPYRFVKGAELRSQAVPLKSGEDFVQSKEYEDYLHSAKN